MKRITALLLALIMVFAMAACGETSPEETGNNGQNPASGDGTGFYLHPSDYRGELPLVAEGEDNKLLIGVRTSASVEDYNDNAFTKWVEEQTGVDVEFMQFSGSAGDAATQISLMLASGERLPDVLLNIGGIALLEHFGSHNNYLNLTVMAGPVGLLNYILNGIFVYKKKPKFFNVNRKRKSDNQDGNKPNTAEPLPDMEA